AVREHAAGAAEQVAQVQIAAHEHDTRDVVRFDVREQAPDLALAVTAKALPRAPLDGLDEARQHDRAGHDELDRGGALLEAALQPVELLGAQDAIPRDAVIAPIQEEDLHRPAA